MKISTLDILSARIRKALICYDLNLSQISATIEEDPFAVFPGVVHLLRCGHITEVDKGVFHLNDMWGLLTDSSEALPPTTCKESLRELIKWMDDYLALITPPANIVQFKSSHFIARDAGFMEAFNLIQTRVGSIIERPEGEYPGFYSGEIL